MRNKNNTAVRLTVLAAAVFGATLAHAATTVTPGQFKVGMEITYPPFESYDKDKNVVGSDPELSQLLARHMDLKTEFVDTKFPSLIRSFPGCTSPLSAKPRPRPSPTPKPALRSWCSRTAR